MSLGWVGKFRVYIEAVIGGDVKYVQIPKGVYKLSQGVTKSSVIIDQHEGLLFPPQLSPNWKKLMNSIDKTFNRKEAHVFAEYALLTDWPTPGVTVVPQSANPFHEWTGFVWMDGGVCRGSIFPFLIQFPQDYPTSPPTITFATGIQHPLIHPDTGDLKIESLVGRWDSTANCMVQVLHTLWSMWLEPKWLDQIEDENSIANQPLWDRIKNQGLQTCYKDMQNFMDQDEIIEGLFSSSVDHFPEGLLPIENILTEEIPIKYHLAESPILNQIAKDAYQKIKSVLASRDQGQ